MYRHILIPTDGSELAERAVTHGLSLAKFLGAKVTVIIVEEQPSTLFAIPDPGVGVAFVELTEQIKKHTLRARWSARPMRPSRPACPARRFRCKTCSHPTKPSLQRPQIGAAISSSWHRTDAADYPQLCLAV